MKARFSFIAFLLLALIQAACIPGRSISPTPHGGPLTPTNTANNLTQLNPTPHNTPTAAPKEVIPSASVTLNVSSVAQNFASQQMAPVPSGENTAWWEPMPGYMLISLSGYPITRDLIQPRIVIYPASELGTANENAGKMAAILNSLIQSPREIPNMPFLPLTNEVQIMHTHLQYLDFKTGQGLRYLVEFGNGISPINNAGLIYTYQGMTSDGKYYVAAVLPVHHPSLPADATVTGKEPPEFRSDYPKYRANVASALNTQAANTFMPDLTLLDAMMSSLEIK